MASTEKLPSGRYRGVYRDSAGAKQRVKGTFRLSSEAQAAAEEAEVLARRQAPKKAGTLPATTKWGDWWDVLSAGRIFDSDNLKNEVSIVEVHLRPWWGETPLIDIDDIEIQKWVDSYRVRRTPTGARYKPASVKRYYSVLAVSINEAIRHKILSTSPLRGVKLPVIPRRVAKPYLPSDEAPDLIAEMPLGYGNVISFGFETGLRPGELAGLHHDQIDRRRGILTARTVYLRGLKRMRDHPKDDDERDIPLTTRAEQILDEVTAGRDMKRPCGIEHLDRACQSDLIFRTARGKPIETNTLGAIMRRAAARLGIANRTMYTLRRGYATRLRDGGADAFTIMALLGHSNFEESRGYVQQGPQFNIRARSFLGDPEVDDLQARRVRGTARGTEVESQALNETHTDSEREA